MEKAYIILAFWCFQNAFVAVLNICGPVKRIQASKFGGYLVNDSKLKNGSERKQENETTHSRENIKAPQDCPHFFLRWVRRSSPVRVASDDGFHFAHKFLVCLAGFEFHIQV